jgi:riboflavin synthase
VFTGIIQELGRIEHVGASADGVTLTVSAALAAELREGDSIAVSGVCLTASPEERTRFRAELMHETLSRTSLADAVPGTLVNLELPLRASDRLGGHIVQGHVDGLGTIGSVAEDGFARLVRIEAPAQLLRYSVQKGSIAIDGVSLTIASIGPRSFTVSLIPETLKLTTLGQLQPGARVNLEVDVLAKYVEKLIKR